MSEGAPGRNKAGCNSRLDISIAKLGTCYLYCPQCRDCAFHADHGAGVRNMKNQQFSYLGGNWRLGRGGHESCR